MMDLLNEGELKHLPKPKKENYKIKTSFIENLFGGYICNFL